MHKFPTSRYYKFFYDDQPTLQESLGFYDIEGCWEGLSEEGTKETIKGAQESNPTFLDGIKHWGQLCGAWGLRMMK